MQKEIKGSPVPAEEYNNHCAILLFIKSLAYAG